MDKLTRTPAPQWLAEKCEDWGKQWQQKYQHSGKTSDFSWRRHKGQGYEDLVESLKDMNGKRCAYCDAYPMGSRISVTVDHFRPKSLFPLLAYDWFNLFLCCGNCQKRGDVYDDLLLKPDEDSYQFCNYFDVNFVTGELIPSPYVDDDAQRRAQYTIEAFGLNRYGKPEDRLEELAFYQQLSGTTSDMDTAKLAYRFFIHYYQQVL